MTIFKRAIVTTACVAAMAAGLTACGSSSESGTSTSTASSAVPTKPATKPARLVVRLWGGADQEVYEETAAKAFTAATGIPIKWDTTDEAVSYAKINQQIASGDRPSADASLNAQQRAYTNAARGWTVPINPALAPNMAKVTTSTARPVDTTSASWPYLIPYTLSVPFIVRTDKIDPSKVQTWDDLFKPDLAKGLVLDSIYSSTAFGFAGSMGVDPAKGAPSSMDPVWSRIAKLKPNLAQLGSNADVVTALTNGTVKVAISNIGSGISAKAAGAPVKMVAPKNGLYVVGDAYYIHKGIPAENSYYAQVFANYLLDPTVQSAVAAKLGFVPVNPAATVPKYMSDDPKVFPRSEADLKAVGAILAPIPLMAKNDAPWQKAFENAIGGG
jgi:putative spermidine/putrescine transport system substrate-binding protein